MPNQQSDGRNKTCSKHPISGELENIRTTRGVQTDGDTWLKEPSSVLHPTWYVILQYVILCSTMALPEQETGLFGCIKGLYWPQHTTTVVLVAWAVGYGARTRQTRSRFVVPASKNAFVCARVSKVAVLRTVTCCIHSVLLSHLSAINQTTTKLRMHQRRANSRNKHTGA